MHGAVVADRETLLWLSAMYYLLFNGDTGAHPYSTLKDCKVVSTYLENLETHETKQAMASMKRRWRDNSGQLFPTNSGQLFPTERSAVG